jgi:type VI secretion system protein ImpL
MPSRSCAQTSRALFSLASQNTAVDVAEVADRFQPVHSVVPPDSAKFVTSSNEIYMRALLQLQLSIETASHAPGRLDDEVIAPILSSAFGARTAARQILYGFRVDTQNIGVVLQRLMENPIIQVEALLRELGPAALNAKGNELCGQMRGLLRKYPFDPRSHAEATLAEVDAIFHPKSGAVWSYYEANLKNLLRLQDTRYVANSEARVRVSPAFLTLFNRAAAVSKAFYAAGAEYPHFSYSVKPVPSEGIQGLRLEMGGDTLIYRGGTPVSKRFIWGGSANGQVRASVTIGESIDLSWFSDKGLWAIFRFFSTAERWQTIGSGFRVEWIIRSRDTQLPVTLLGGKPLTVGIDIDTADAPPIFRPGYLADMTCPSSVAQ